MAAASLPTPKDVRDVLEGLLGRDIDLSTGDAALAEGKQPVVAEYVTDTGKVAACAAVDLELAIYLGAAVSLAPPKGAQEMAAEGELTPMFEENLYEIFNVFSSLLRSDATAQVQLSGMYGPEQELPTQLAGWLSTPVGRLDLKIDVSSYGGGCLVLATGW